MYTHTAINDLASQQHMTRVDHVCRSLKPIASLFHVGTRRHCASSTRGEASLADIPLQRAFHSNRRALAQAAGISSRYCPTPTDSLNAAFTASQSSHQAQLPPRHGSRNMERGSGMPCNPLDAHSNISSRASHSKPQTAVTAASVLQQGVPIQQVATQPQWWHRLNSIAAACTMAALLTAGGPCNLAEARARLTQVNTCPYLLTCCVCLVSISRSGMSPCWLPTSLIEPACALFQHDAC